MVRRVGKTEQRGFRGHCEHSAARAAGIFGASVLAFRRANGNDASAGSGFVFDIAGTTASVSLASAIYCVLARTECGGAGDGGATSAN